MESKILEWKEATASIKIYPNRDETIISIDVTGWSGSDSYPWTIRKEGDRKILYHGASICATSDITEVFNTGIEAIKKQINRLADEFITLIDNEKIK